MSLKRFTKQETVEALKKLFDYETNKENRAVVVSEKDGTTTFMVNKMYMERYEVITKLQQFFEDKVVENGQVRIEGITLVFTVFHVEDR